MLPIDAKDPMGNTLLSVACQNNNKRIAKLCMRRGADINTQNVRPNLVSWASWPSCRLIGQSLTAGSTASVSS